MKIDIKKLIKNLGLKDIEELAGAVIDVKAQEACDINNGGIEEQVGFLLKGSAVKTQKGAETFIMGSINT